jgi:hypothetical protein
MLNALFGRTGMAQKNARMTFDENEINKINNGINKNIRIAYVGNLKMATYEVDEELADLH